MFKVTFEYCEESRKWDVFVEGAETELEAKQGFAAVALTCMSLDQRVFNLNKTEQQPDGRIKMIVAI